MTVTYLKNRSPIKALASHGTPYKAWYHHKPDLSHLRPFGCIAYHSNKDLHQKKIGEVSWRVGTSWKCSELDGNASIQQMETHGISWNLGEYSVSVT